MLDHTFGYRKSKGGRGADRKFPVSIGFKKGGNPTSSCEKEGHSDGERSGGKKEKNVYYNRERGHESTGLQVYTVRVTAERVLWQRGAGRRKRGQRVNGSRKKSQDATTTPEEKILPYTKRSVVFVFSHGGVGKCATH